jgi:ubiquinone/menaquinone biosynthesis C-methylase UbiE
MFEEGGPTFLELMRQALSSTDRGYDLIAPKFDLTPFRTPDAVLEVAAELGGRERPARVLDVCCGTGAAMRAFRPYAKELVVGIDRSRGMLDEARRRMEGTAGAARVAYVRGDALDLPFDGAFDLAVSFGAFGHILEEDEPRFVAAIRRALAPGGQFVFATADVPPVTSPGWWLARGFNAAMRVRNFVIKPEFVMYYLTFATDRATSLLEREGMHVEVHERVFPKPYGRLSLVVARR